MTDNNFMRVFAPKILLLFTCFIIATASMGGFFEKWNFRDGSRFSAVKMLDGTADRPFVYRQLLPAMANMVEKVTPPAINQRLQDWLAANPEKHNMLLTYFPNATDSADVRYSLRYYSLYGFTFTALFFAVFALRAVCKELYDDVPAATLAAFTMALILPLLLTEGGYFYDMPELLFMALAFLLAMRGQVGWLTVVVVLATLNKETFLFFIMTLYPFLRAKYSLRSTLLVEVLLLAIAAAINITIKLHYAGNGGEIAENQLLEHIKWLLHPSSYSQFEVNYGMPTPKGFNIVHLLVLGILVRNAWTYLTPPVRQHIAIALAINVPLFLVFCYRGELRNLSMLFVTLTLLIFFNISMVLQRWYNGRASFQRH